MHVSVGKLVCMQLFVHTNVYVGFCVQVNAAGKELTQVALEEGTHSWLAPLKVSREACEKLLMKPFLKR